MASHSGKPDFQQLFERLTRIARMQSALLFILLVAVFFLMEPARWILGDTDKSPLEIKGSTAISNSSQEKKILWEAPNIEDETDEAKKKQLRYGKELVVNTANYFGPSGTIEANRTNGLNCQNCHLDAGTKVFGNNYSRVSALYPKMRARSGQVEDVYKRINDCFERSLNGKALDPTSKEMEAMVAYILFVGKDVPKGETPEGSGFKDLAFLERPIDPEKGRKVYQEKCISCHQSDGQGLIDKSGRYTYPPLWGPLSYNDGAGLYRMSNFAKYVKWNMPLGASHDSPQLTDEEAWDVAAWVNTQSRPKKDLKGDWPDRSKKPFDHPFGPYSDGFSEEQHKFGPYGPIKKYRDDATNGLP